VKIANEYLRPVVLGLLLAIAAAAPASARR
jgi:hypothetical protein